MENPIKYASNEMDYNAVIVCTFTIKFKKAE